MVPGTSSTLGLHPSRATGITRIMLRTPSKHVIQTIICLILVYLSWGSSFIGIKFGLTSFPPFLLIGIRMLLAGIILFTLIWMRGERNIPTLQDFRHTFVLAIYMVFIASGFLAKGQETVSSGTAAMILGTTPIWMVLGGWLIWKEKRPTPIQFAGLGGGFFGLVLLSVNQGISGESSLLGILLVLSAPLAWVVGSFYSKKHARETRLSVIQNSSLLMAVGGIQCLAASIALGEVTDFHVTDVTGIGAAALIYLIFSGGIIAYTCYFWLLLHTRTEVAISYEYVNPVIGVFLGWLLADEQVDIVVILACLLTVSSVFFIVSGHRR